MPSIRRRRSASESEDEYEDAAETSTPDAAQAQSKRRRLGVNGRRSNVDDGGEEEDESRTVENGDAQMQTVEEDELDDEEAEMDDEGTQAVVGETGEAEIGVIEKISLTNFMCHDRMEVSLGAKLNFIVGNNGSGKSAVLTAITIALGGKATSTSRGNSLKSFVKEGKQTAVVEVTLRNTGMEAFKPSLYKNKIIIERTIRADGTGTWKIKSEDKKLISTKREELNAICDHANIQVDNPMNILTQDAARQFLSGSHSGEKYDFFLRGTQLQQLAQEYDTIRANSDRIGTIITRKSEGLPMLKEKAVEANQLLEVIQKAADQKKAIALLREQLVWASVEEQEKLLESYIERIERLKLKRERVEANQAKSIEEETAHEVTITELEKKVSETTNRETPIITEMRELKDKEKALLAEIKVYRDEENILNEQFKRIKMQLKGVNDRIDAENRKLQDGNQGKRSALQRQRYQAEAEKKKMERDEADQRDRVLELDRDIAEQDRKASEAYDKQERLRKEVADSGSMINTLQVMSRNKLAAYGPRIPSLLSAIERETRWRQRPVGPIGNHLTLPDISWAPVLESVMGNTLNAFCVTNVHDRNLLLNIKRSVGCDEVPVLTGSDELFDFSAGEPDRDVLTILRVLNVDSPYLIRQLINSLHIEQCALVRARADGDVLMRQNRRNVKLCYSMDLYRLGGAVGGRTGSSTTTLQQHRGAPRLNPDTEGRLKVLRDKFQADEGNLRDVSRKLEDLLQVKREMNEERAQCRQKIPSLQRKARECHADIERIEEELREDEPTNIGALVEARKDFEAEHNKIPEQMQVVHEKIENVQKMFAPLNRERLEKKKLLEEMQSRSRELKPDLDKAATQRLKAHNDWLHWGKELAKLPPLEESLQSSISVCEKELERRTAAAEGHSERVSVEKPVKYYEKAIEVAELQLQAAAKRHGMSIEAITIQVKQYSEAFHKAAVEIKALKEVLKDLDGAINIRLSRWRLFRRMIAVRAKSQFDQYLSRRGYSGTLSFDHTSNQLNLTVRTDEATNGLQDKDPKSLSGGEKSFATICLLLALWESIGCPIRCLDEFDVFMDAVNRKISVSMMTEAAAGPSGIQYILITPQGVDKEVKSNGDVRVYRMNDPERNQTTLQFASVAA